MKISELYESVAKLGFEDSLEDIPAFFYAANRAVLQVNALRPLTSILELYERIPENLATDGDHEITEHTAEDIIVLAKGAVKAYYFEVLGEGECRIEVYNSALGAWEIKEYISFSSRVFAAYRGFIKPDGEFVTDEVRLRFIGDYAYSIRNVAMYGVIYSSDAKDIPAFTERIRYDLREIVKDFIGLADQPFVDGYERMTKDYVIEDGGVLLLPRESCKEIKIKYNRRPAALKYTSDPRGDDTEIELDAELTELLPLLVAAYIWADEGDGKYALYLELYRERAAEIERRAKSKEPAEYKLSGGW